MRHEKWNRIGRALVQRGALVALAGLVAAPSVAEAADCCRWELRVKRKAVLSDTFTVELWAHFPDSGYAFFDGWLDLKTDGGTWISTELCGGETFTGEPGTIVGDDVLDIYVVHQIGFFPPDPSNPIRVWCGEFESNCRASGYRKIWTDTNGYEYFVSWGMGQPSKLSDCDPIEANRSVFCGPIVIDDWLAAPSLGTMGEVVRDTLVLTPERRGGEIGAAVGHEGIDWSGPAVFGAEIDVAGLPSGATLDLTWFPWVNCWLIADPWITLAALKKGEDLVVTPDFSRAGITTAPVRAYRDGKLVGEGVLPTGASFGLHRFCSDLWWCYELNQFDQLVLVLKCKDWFMLSLPGQPEVEVDRVELAPRGVEGAFGGVDRLELRATGVEKLVVLDAGDPDGGCYADCDESGELDFFDFLCFQNAFAAGDPYADCDGSGRHDFFDFLCFQDAFAAACP